MPLLLLFLLILFLLPSVPPKPKQPTAANFEFTVERLDGPQTPAVFVMSPKSGVQVTQLQVAPGAALDREVAANYSLRISVIDGLGRSDSLIVTVIVDDVNDNRPVLSPAGPAGVVVQIEESAAVGSSLGRPFAVTDADVGINAALSYRVVLTAGAIPFALDPLTGELTTTAPLDREATDQFTFTMVVSDAGSPQLTVEGNVTINVLDVNDNKPVFDLQGGIDVGGIIVFQVAISENATVGALIGTFPATDADSGANAIVRYSILSGNTGSVFTLNATTASLRLAGALDRESVRTYSLQLRASDGLVRAGDPDNVASVFVEVLDVNDNAPVFSQVRHICYAVHSGCTAPAMP